MLESERFDLKHIVTGSYSNSSKSIGQISKSLTITLLPLLVLFIFFSVSPLFPRGTSFVIIIPYGM
jgi:hypothetical protein